MKKWNHIRFEINQTKSNQTINTTFGIPYASIEVVSKTGDIEQKCPDCGLVIKDRLDKDHKPMNRTYAKHYQSEHISRLG